MLGKIDRLITQEAPNFSFRPLSLGDVPLYMKWFNDEKVRKNLWPTTPRTLEDITEFVQQKIAGADQYYILESDNKAIGHAGIREIDRESKEATLSIVIGEPDVLGSGVGFQAMAHFFDFVFSHFDFEKINIFRAQGVNVGRKIFPSLGFRLSEQPDGRTKYSISKSQFYDLKDKFTSTVS